ncbi:hypothetical protein LPJ61_003642, partial [Coemansia biformis]
MHAVAGDVGAAREASDVAATDGSGHASTGSNARSFRFLLTLALRKAQTAVTLDNGGHVDEAIRTYREAISMLGLVLDRTSEEDGRQRLLHFVINQNKPLPYVLGTPEAPTVQRKLSTASNDTSDSATQASEPSADHAAAAAAAGDAGSTPQPSASGQSTIAASADRRAPAGNGAGAADSAEARPSDKAARRKARDKDSEKASRRQSIKNQRSLPAMFGIGAKAKNDSKAAPPVPPLM